MAFSGFGENARDWFAGLEADNSKDYFEANRERMNSHVREPLEKLLSAAAFRMEGQVKLFRPHRDVRFSKDKSPYKTTASGYVHSVPGSQSGGYFAIDARGATCATGMWELAKDQLDRARQTINEDATAAQSLEDAIEAGEAYGLEQWGEALKSAPRGYDKAHRYIALLRKKNFVRGTSCTKSRRSTRRSC